MKRKRGGRKPGKKSAPAAAAAEAVSPESTSSPSTEATDSPADQAEDNAPDTTTAVQVPEPAPPPPPAAAAEPPQKPTAVAPVNPADITYAKPKVGAVYGRVKLKFKSSKAVEPPPPQQGSSEAQAPAADASKPGSAAAPEGGKEIAAEKVTAVTDAPQTEGQTSEVNGSDKEKGLRKIGGIKIKSAGLSSVENKTPERKADSVGEPSPSKQEAETVSEKKESEDIVEVRSSQESDEKPSTPERQRDEKELAAALEAIKKVMKMDAAEPFNTPVDPVALGIPDYFDIIDTPMDFGTICQELECGNKYMNSEDVYKDVQFIWDNCTKYNSKGDYIIELMKRVKKAFMKNWLAAGLYSDAPESGGNDNTGDEDAKGNSKSKSKSKRRRPGNDRHKNDCICAVCQVTRRKKERDEVLAVIDNETSAMNSNTSDHQNMEGNSGANNLGGHDTSSSQEQPLHTDVYKETTEAKGSGIQVEGPGKFSSDRPSSLPHPDYEDEGSRQYPEDREEVEYRDMNGREEHAPTQPNDYPIDGHHQQQAQIETSQEVEMEDDPILQENHSFLRLCASLFPINQSSTFRGRHSLFRQRRKVPLKESPLHAAMTVIMKR
ncbi:hypothetical protein ACP70R_002792 [Stipagrostis hirtigluma subsp. patula]